MRCLNVSLLPRRTFGSFDSLGDCVEELQYMARRSQGDPANKADEMSREVQNSGPVDSTAVFKLVLVFSF